MCLRLYKTAHSSQLRPGAGVHFEGAAIHETGMVARRAGDVRASDDCAATEQQYELAPRFTRLPRRRVRAGYPGR